MLADAFADLDARRQERRKEAADRRRQERIDYAGQLAAIDAEYRRIKTLCAAVLLSAGWRDHKRQWRRRKWQVENVTMADLPVKRADDYTREEVADLLARCNRAKPTPADLADLRLFLQQSTNATMIALGASAQIDAIIDATDNNAANKLVMKAEARRLADDLGYKTCPPQERDVIGHIVTCWLRTQILEHKLTTLTSQAHERREAEHIDRRLIAAQGRYIRAMALLTKMRALSVGNLQVNVAHGPQQVNNNTP